MNEETDPDWNYHYALSMIAYTLSNSYIHYVEKNIQNFIHVNLL